MEPTDGILKLHIFVDRSSVEVLANDGLRTVNMEQWNFKAIDVVNGHVRRQDEKVAAMRQGMELMQQGHISTEPLVTVYDFAQIERVFRNLTDGTPDLFKAVLLMEKT